MSASLIGDKVIGASPQAIALDAELVFQLEPLRGDAVLGLCTCTFDNGMMAGTGKGADGGEETGVGLDRVDGWETGTNVCGVVVVVEDPTDSWVTFFISLNFCEVTGIEGRRMLDC